MTMLDDKPPVEIDDTPPPTCVCKRPVCMFNRLDDRGQDGCLNEQDGADGLCEYCREDERKPHCHDTYCMTARKVKDDV